MPRIVIQYIKCEGFRKALRIEINGVISATIQPNTSYDKIIFTGENELVIFCGQTKSELIRFSIGERETITFNCQTSGHFTKAIQIEKFLQKSYSKRFSTGSHSNLNEYEDQNDISQSWRAILGVSDDATKDEIRSTYIELMKKHHPDKILQLSSQGRQHAEEMAMEINRAYTYAKKYFKF
jgi:hypothetical protein